VALGFFDLSLYRMGITSVAGIPMVDLRAPALSDYQLLAKRLFDLLIGSILLIISLPIMLVASILIWIDDRGPSIFKQKRVGENGKIFTVYKFRTMVGESETLQHLVEQQDAEGHIIHKFKDDPRVTRMGKILRRTSIDELPQLINVLNGTMSLVGPRPELPYLVDRYQPWQRKRFAVPPGITGWWQVTGRSDRPMHLNTEDDLFYIQNYSILLDIQILIRTIWVVLFGKGSY
jgi:exopolysaccharide biosynthesis polyprenyl glycosylphosphotransferase